MLLEIIYRDPNLVGINKPAGLLTHRSPIANDATEFAVQMLRDQIGQPVFPTHRLDRKTSGVLLFALNRETNSLVQQQFANRKTKKTYLALVRGFTPENEIIDYPLVNDNGLEQEAITSLRTLERFEINVPLGKHATSRYSLVEFTPATGRFHQLRKHAAHIFHPIIGDRPHGCNKQNRLWKEKWGMTKMLLHASKLSFLHPHTGQETLIEAQMESTFLKTLKMLRDNTVKNQV